MKHHPGRGLSVRPESTLGEPEPPPRLFQPPLGQQRTSELPVGNAGYRLLAPAVPLG